MAPLYYDGTTSLSHFLHVLDHEDQKFYPLLSPSAWIEAVHCHLIGEALEWAKNDEVVVKIHYNAYHNVAVDLDGRTLYQLLNDRFATSLSHRVDKVLKGIKQESHESIESYCIRVNTLFEHAGGQDRPIDIDQYLDYEHDSCLLKVIDWFVDGLRNNKLRRNLVKVLQDVSAEGRITAVSLESICNATQWAYTTIKTARKLRNQLYTDDGIVIDMSQSCLEETSCNLPEISTSIYPPPHTTSKPGSSQGRTVDESPPVSEQIPCDLPEISTAVDITNIKTRAKPTASESVKWATASTSLQKPLFDTRIVNESPLILNENTCSLSESCVVDITNTPGKPVASELADWPVSTNLQKSSPKASSIVDESPPVLEELSPKISEISIATVGPSDTESTDELLASEPCKWPASNTLPEPTTVYESPPVSLQKPSQMQEKCSVSSPPVSPSRTSKPWLSQNWRARPSPETCIVDESPSVLEKLPPKIPEINEDIMDSSDTESIESMDEILASGPRKWTIATAEKEVFDSTVTSHAISKSPPVPHIEKDIEAVKAPDKACAESIVDVETLNQEVFALAVIFDAFSKNPSASYTKDIEFPAAMDAPSLEHLTNEDVSATGAFDSDTTIGAPSKNPSMQQTEDSETLEKNSACIYELPVLPTFDLSIDIDFDFCTIDTETVEPHTKIQTPCETTCELPVLPTFDLGIDIDFEVYKTSTETKSFGWSRSCTNSIGRRISSISTCTSVSDVASISSDVTSISTVTSIDCATTTVEVTNFCEGEQMLCSWIKPAVSASIEYTTESATNFCEGEQSSCFVDSSISAYVDVISVSEDTNFYGGEQSLCSPVDAIATVVVDTDALTLTAGMIEKKKPSACMSLLGLILLFMHLFVEYMVKKLKHKGLPKVKIKGY